MYALLGKHNIATTLESFAKIFFDSLGVPDYQERESSHYPEETYFKGIKDSVTYKVAIADIPDFTDMPYEIHVSRNGQDDKDIESLLDNLTRTKLLPNGFQIAKLAFHGQNVERTDYSLSNQI